MFILSVCGDWGGHDEIFPFCHAHNSKHFEISEMVSSSVLCLLRCRTNENKLPTMQSMSVRLTLRRQSRETRESIEMSEAKPFKHLEHLFGVSGELFISGRKEIGLIQLDERIVLLESFLRCVKLIGIWWNRFKSTHICRRPKVRTEKKKREIFGGFNHWNVSSKVDLYRFPVQRNSSAYTHRHLFDSLQLLSSEYIIKLVSLPSSRKNIFVSFFFSLLRGRWFRRLLQQFS